MWSAVPSIWLLCPVACTDQLEGDFMTDASEYSRPNMNDWNRQIMDEFHANEGKSVDRLRECRCSCLPPPELKAGSGILCR